MATSLDLRRRAVEAYERGEGSLDAVAARFAIGRASLIRWRALKQETGALNPRPSAGGTPYAVTEAGEVLLKQWIADDPSTPQHVLAGRLVEAGQPPVCQQTVGRTLARMGYTRKKSR